MKKPMLSRLLLLASASLVTGLSGNAADPADFYRPFPAGLRQAKTFTYRPSRGETLFDIAGRFLENPYRAKELAEMNHIADPLRLAEGAELQIPLPKLGIRYWIEKVDPAGEITECRPEDKLSAGDRFQLRLAANWNGYLYVFSQSGGGEIRRLFPAGNRPLQVLAFNEYPLPAKGLLQLDSAPGEDALLVVFSDRKLADLDALLDSGLLDRTGGERVRHYVDSTNRATGITIVNNDSPDEPETQVFADPAEGRLLLAHRIVIRRR